MCFEPVNREIRNNELRRKPCREEKNSKTTGKKREKENTKLQSCFAEKFSIPRAPFLFVSTASLTFGTKLCELFYSNRSSLERIIRNYVVQLVRKSDAHRWKDY